MTEDKDPTLRDNVSWEKATHDLTSDLSLKEKGGWNPEGRRHLIKGRMENDVRIITYTFDASSPTHEYRNEGGAILEFDKTERTHIRSVLDEIEKIANIRFEPAKAGEKADISYFKYRPYRPADTGYEIEVSPSSREPAHEIMLARGVVGSVELPLETGVIRHETFHALGFSHPNNDSANPKYTRCDTLMSGRDGCPETIRPLDEAVLKFLYGDVKLKNDDKIPLIQPTVETPLTPATQPSKDKART